MAGSSLTEDLRKEIFRSVVEAEDRGNSPHEARVHIAAQYHISTDQVRAIEAEGIENTWPPLECDEEEE
jgi:hypothetical protein